MGIHWGKKPHKPIPFENSNAADFYNLFAIVLCKAKRRQHQFLTRRMDYVVGLIHLHFPGVGCNLLILQDDLIDLRGDIFGVKPFRGDQHADGIS